jgi:hypothetical protein
MNRAAAGVTALAGALAAFFERKGASMPIWNRNLWRAASRLHAVYAAVPRSDIDFALPESDWQEVGRLAKRLSFAVGHNWTTAASRTREALATELERLGRQLRNLSVRVQAARRTVSPTIQMLYDELRATVVEFGGLEIDDMTLSVTTEAIVLEGVRLGRFVIQLDTGRLGSDSPYSIIALEPNRAGHSRETTHPHVHGERLCPGEGRSAIAAALAEGRLLDFFTVVDRILHTYSEGSAYVELNNWYGRPCHDCDCTVDEDDAFSCQNCDETLCGNCLQSCGDYGVGHCSGCIDCCPECEERYCSDCLKNCLRCRRAVCGSCLDENVCTSCLEELEHAEQQEEETSETSDAPTESAV